jgi:hypothetical protein
MRNLRNFFDSAHFITNWKTYRFNYYFLVYYTEPLENFITSDLSIGSINEILYTSFGSRSFKYPKRMDNFVNKYKSNSKSNKILKIETYQRYNVDGNYKVKLVDTTLPTLNPHRYSKERIKELFLSGAYNFTGDNGNIISLSTALRKSKKKR